ncbi:hypothetical protein FRC12_012344 [Ceratobasidium sp. 428]|nr:hypothetical protein FRC12_012344 [Ceratobasidium sp. 428]
MEERISKSETQILSVLDTLKSLKDPLRQATQHISSLIYGIELAAARREDELKLPRLIAITATGPTEY